MRVFYAIRPVSQMAISVEVECDTAREERIKESTS